MKFHEIGRIHKLFTTNHLRYRRNWKIVLHFLLLLFCNYICQFCLVRISRLSNEDRRNNYTRLAHCWTPACSGQKCCSRGRGGTRRGYMWRSGTSSWWVSTWWLAGSFLWVHPCVCRLYSSVNCLVLFNKHILHPLIGRLIHLQVSFIHVSFLFYLELCIFFKNVHILG